MMRTMAWTVAAAVLVGSLAGQAFAGEPIPKGNQVELFDAQTRPPEAVFPRDAGPSVPLLLAAPLPCQLACYREYQACIRGCGGNLLCRERCSEDNTYCSLGCEESGIAASSFPGAVHCASWTGR